MIYLKISASFHQNYHGGCWETFPPWCFRSGTVVCWKGLFENCLMKNVLNLPLIWCPWLDSSTEWMPRWPIDAKRHLRSGNSQKGKVKASNPTHLLDLNWKNKCRWDQRCSKAAGVKLNQNLTSQPHVFWWAAFFHIELEVFSYIGSNIKVQIIHFI